MIQMSAATIPSTERKLITWLQSNNEIKKHELECFVAMVTPAVAQLFLDTGAKNRPLKKLIVERYMRDMEAGRWGLTGEPLILDYDLSLRNGQHRCAACIRSQVPFTTVIIAGVPPEAFDRMDQHAKRTCADVFSMRGEVSANHLTACCVILWHWEKNRLCGWQAGHHVPTVSELEGVLAAHPAIREFRKGYADRAHGMKCSDAALAVCHYLFSGIDRVAADLFFAQFTDGQGLAADSPIRALRERLIRDSIRRRNIRLREVMALTIKAWNAYRSGKPTMRMTWRGFADEEFPAIAGL